MRSSPIRIASWCCATAPMLGCFRTKRSACRRSWRRSPPTIRSMSGRRRDMTLPRRGLAQILALVAILLIDRMVSPQFFDLRLQDGRLFGSLVDVLNRGAPVALLSLGMVLVIATGGNALSGGSAMASSRAIAPDLSI